MNHRFFYRVKFVGFVGFTRVFRVFKKFIGIKFWGKTHKFALTKRMNRIKRKEILPCTRSKIFVKKIFPFFFFFLLAHFEILKGKKYSPSKNPTDFQPIRTIPTFFSDPRKIYDHNTSILIPFLQNTLSKIKIQEKLFKLSFQDQVETIFLCKDESFFRVFQSICFPLFVTWVQQPKSRLIPCKDISFSKASQR